MIKASKRKNIGEFRHLGTFQKADLAADGMGGASEQWEDLVEDFIRIAPAGGRQRLEMESQKSPIDSVITARFRNDLDLLGYAKKKYDNELRIKCGDKIYNIQYVINEDEYNAWFQMGAKSQ